MTCFGKSDDDVFVKSDENCHSQQNLVIPNLIGNPTEIPGSSPRMTKIVKSDDDEDCQV